MQSHPGRAVRRREARCVRTGAVVLPVLLLLVGAELLGQRAPEPGTTRYVVLNHGRRAGSMEVVAGGDSALVRFRSQDRNRVVRLVTTYRFAGPVVTGLERRDLSTAPDRDTGRVSERFRRENGLARWTTPVDSGLVRGGDAIYAPRSPIPYDVALLAASLLARPGRSAATLPAGDARVAIVADTALDVGGRRQRLRLAIIENDGAFPPRSAVWLDERGELFASEAAWIVTVRTGAEPALPTLRAIELAWGIARAEAGSRELAAPRPATLVIRGGDVFDSERGTVRPRTTIVVQGERIVAVGPTDSVATPRGATVIDASGKTVLPGLWDMHTHEGGGVLDAEGSALVRLATGITTVRDLVADRDVIALLRDRIEAGTLLAPRIIPAGFMDGPGLLAGPSDAIIRDEDEGVAWVARYDSLGYRQVKLYNLVHPYWVRPIAAEAHRRGMRVSGHVPTGMGIPAAIAAGYDEINHAGFLLTTFFPDSFVVPRTRLMGGVTSAVSAGFDVDSPRVTELIALLRERRTVVDGTFNLFEDRGVALPDGSDAVFGPTLAWLPPLARRSLASAARSEPEANLAQRRSATMRGLLKRLFDAGVTLVPGTDNFPGLAFHGELEIYQRAGIPAAAILQMATITSARVMGEEKDYGSIAVGKVADLAIVPGRVERDVRLLRCTEHVVTRGRPFRTAVLYRAAGLTPRTCAPSSSRE